MMDIFINTKIMITRGSCVHINIPYGIKGSLHWKTDSVRNVIIAEERRRTL